jgi:alkylated DNA repair protein alkB family protein 6
MDFKTLLQREIKHHRKHRDGDAKPALTTLTNTHDIEAHGFVDTPCCSSEQGHSVSSHSRALGGVPGLEWIPNFMGPKDAAALEYALLHTTPTSWWTGKSNNDGRRVMNAGGAAPSAQWTHEDAERTPRYLHTLMTLMGTYGALKATPNHVLVNEYACEGGIDPHSDGDVYEEDVAILTLRGGALIEFWPREGPVTYSGEDTSDGPRPVTSVFLQPGSLLLYRDEAYRLRHGIRRNAVDVATERTANADALGLRPGDAVARNPLGRVSVVFVRKSSASALSS